MEMTTFVGLSFEIVECCACGVKFGMPTSLDKKLRENRRDFYCPNGHKQHYVAETEAEKLRKELRRKEQELADQVQAKLNAQNALNKAQKKLKRVSNGVCPCCNRSFVNLQRHMKTKHPEHVKK